MPTLELRAFSNQDAWGQSSTMNDLSLVTSWVEISQAAIRHNVQCFRDLVGPEKRLLFVVKGNAYGHGLIPVAHLVLEAGADWLAVFTLDEALTLRRADITAPILVLGGLRPAWIPLAIEHDIRLTLPGPELLPVLEKVDCVGLELHVKLETGTNRQGFQAKDLPLLAELKERKNLVLEGVYTHYADIEDTTDHAFAQSQTESYDELLRQCHDLGIDFQIHHSSCTAATILFPQTHRDMVRVGIGLYGLWPSTETLVSAKERGRATVDLQPVMCWKTRIAQTKWIEPGEFIGYGRTFRAARKTRLAVLPVGYANGYDRLLSGKAHVLIEGQRAMVLGRVMMNMIVADVTDIPQAALDSEVVLLGKQGDEAISAEMMASWLSTINYEVVTRVSPEQPRVIV